MAAIITWVCLSSACGPKHLLPWAGPVQSKRIDVAVVRGAETVPTADLIVRYGPPADPGVWRDIPSVALDGSVPMRRHVRRHERVEGAARTPYGQVGLTTGDTTWHLTWLTGEGGRHGDEQAWWLPRALAAEHLVVAVDRPLEGWFAEIEEATSPLALAVWIRPGPVEEALPRGPYGPLVLGDGSARIRLEGASIRVERDGVAWERDNRRWAVVPQPAVEAVGPSDPRSNRSW